MSRNGSGKSRPRASMIRTTPCCSITALRPLPSGIETIAKGWVRPPATSSNLIFTSAFAGAATSIAAAAAENA